MRRNEKNGWKFSLSFRNDKNGLDFNFVLFSPDFEEDDINIIFYIIFLQQTMKYINIQNFVSSHPQYGFFYS